MFDFDEIKENLDNFSVKEFAEEKPVVFISICLIIFLFLAGLIILLIQLTPEKAPVFEAEERFEADAPVIIPDPPKIEKDYYPSRITENKWSQKDVDKWFTYPEENVMSDLRDSNDKIVKEIIGAAP